MKKKWIFPAVLAFLVRLYPYVFLADGWVVEDGPVIYWFRVFLSGGYQYLRMYPHTAIVGMSLLNFIGVPFIWAAKIWGPLMGMATTYFLYKLLKSYNLNKSAIYGATLYACLGASIYRTCSLSTSLEATAVCISVLFLWLWNKGEKRAYLLLPLIAYSHFIVFFATTIYLVGNWWTYTEASYSKRIIVLGGLCVGGLILLKFLPVGYALYQVLRTITNIDLSKLLYLYSIHDYFIIVTSLAVTTVLFIFSLFCSKIKEIKTISWLYVLAVVVTTLFHSPIVSPYRLVLHMGLIGIIGFSSCLNKLNPRKTMLLVGILCLLSLYQVNAVGLDEHVSFNDAFTEDEQDMLVWLHEYDPIVDYSRVLWDDVGIENTLTCLPLVIDIDPYTTRSKDYGLWHAQVESKRELINSSTTNSDHDPVSESIVIDYDPTPSHILYVMYSKRYASRALYRLPEEYGKLVYRNYPVKDIWCTLPEWILVYEKAGNKIYEKR